ncbi:MAG: DNA-binding response regulator [Pseudonocardia sp. SCN 72-86]|mgnify:CR=1 FL=1|nr:MAG: DNA-binding response regulator [Pseudonocardia sp. SCN 72-86]
MTPIRVAIVDDHDLIRGGMRAILDAEPDVQVVAEATDGTGAARIVAAAAADVVLMDVRMPGTDGIAATGEVLAALPRCRVLVLTMFDLDEYVVGALRAGASGFLLKTTPPAELADAVRACHRGDLLFAPTVTRRLVEAYVRTPPPGVGVPERLRALTPRELDVLREIARGLSNAEIARCLFLGEATVKTHVTRVLAKLGLRDRVQAVVVAYESGLAVPGAEGPA